MVFATFFHQDNRDKNPRYHAVTLTYDKVVA
jgi:hypothetical protein